MENLNANSIIVDDDCHPVYRCHLNDFWKISGVNVKTWNQSQILTSVRKIEEFWGAYNSVLQLLLINKNKIFSRNNEMLCFFKKEYEIDEYVLAKRVLFGKVIIDFSEKDLEKVEKFFSIFFATLVSGNDEICPHYDRIIGTRFINGCIHVYVKIDSETQIEPIKDVMNSVLNLLSESAIQVSEAWTTIKSKKTCHFTSRKKVGRNPKHNYKTRKV